MCGGGVKVPGPSAEETQLLQQQIALLQQQQQQLQQAAAIQGGLNPILFQQLGLKPSFEKIPVFGPEQAKIQAEIDRLKAVPQFLTQTRGRPNADQTPTQVQNPAFAQAKNQLVALEKKLRALKPTSYKQGNITGFTRNLTPEQKALEAQQKQIESLFTKRTLAALQGKLPVDPALIRQLDESGMGLNDQLRQQLGSGYATSTPGIEALANFSKRRSEVLDAARRGDLTMAQSGGINQSGLNTSLLNNFLGQAGNVAAGPLQLAQAFGQGGGNPLAFLQNQRNQQLQAAMANAQSQGNLFSGIGQLAGVALGAGLGPGGFLLGSSNPFL